MDFANLAAIAEMVNAVAVTLTLIVLIVSIRQNTRAQRVVAVESLTSAITAINIPAMESPALGIALSKVLKDWNSASRDERVIAHYFLFTYLKLGEQAWYQYKSKILDREQWAGWEFVIRNYFHGPGVQASWWPHRKDAYSKPFQDFLAGTTPPAEAGRLGELFADHGRMPAPAQ